MVSIIVPFFNTGKYLRECIDSIFAQTYRDIELILVDDGSTDEATIRIAEESAANPPRGMKVKLIRKENGGPGSARNAGLDNVSGDWIYMLDSDDMITPDAIGSLVRIATENNADRVMFNGSVFTDDPELDYQVENFKDQFMQYYNMNTVMSGLEYLEKLYENPDEEYASIVWTNFNRASYLLGTGCRFPEGIIHEDEAFTFFTLIKAGRLIKIEAPFIRHRLRRASIMYNRPDFNSPRGYACVYRQMLRHMNDESVSERERKITLRHSERFVFYAIRNYAEEQVEAQKAQYSDVQTVIDLARPNLKYYNPMVLQAVEDFENSKPPIRCNLPQLCMMMYR